MAMSDRFKLEMVESNTTKRVYVVEDMKYHDKYIMEKFPITKASAKYLINIGFMISLELMNRFLLLYREVQLDGCTGLVLMEYCEKSNIEVWMHGEERLLEEKEIINISAQIIAGLSFLNDNGIVHRNIEPRNIFLNHNFEVKLANYGVETENACGFAAAEVIEKKEYSLASDIFSAGCVMYYLATRHTPFVGTEEVLEDKYPLITEGEYSNGLKSLIYSMLDKNPTKRPSIWTLMKNPLIRSALDVLPNPTPVPMLRSSFDDIQSHDVGADETTMLTPSLTMEVQTEDTPSLPGQPATSPFDRTVKSSTNNSPNEFL